MMKCVLILLLTLCAALPLTGEALSCESSPAVDRAQRDVDQKLETASFEQMLRLREQAYKQLSQLDPSDYRPIRQYIWFLHYYVPQQLDAFRDNAVAEARTYPEDP